jgi:hypothetical protein
MRPRKYFELSLSYDNYCVVLNYFQMPSVIAYYHANQVQPNVALVYAPIPHPIPEPIPAPVRRIPGPILDDLSDTDSDTDSVASMDRDDFGSDYGHGDDPAILRVLPKCIIPKHSFWDQRSLTLPQIKALASANRVNRSGNKEQICNRLVERGLIEIERAVPRFRLGRDARVPIPPQTPGKSCGNRRGNRYKVGELKHIARRSHLPVSGNLRTLCNRIGYVAGTRESRKKTKANRKSKCKK